MEVEKTGNASEVGFNGWLCAAFAVPRFQRLGLTVHAIAEEAFPRGPVRQRKDFVLMDNCNNLPDGCNISVQ